MGFWDVITSIVPSAIAYTMPLLMGALGGLYSERSGVTNLCIEGLMLFGVFSSAATIGHWNRCGYGCVDAPFGSARDCGDKPES